MAYHPKPFGPGSSAFSLAKEILQKFQAWRREKHSGSRQIPEKLWEDAVRLAGITSVNRVSRFLGLDFSRLKRRVQTKFGTGCPVLPRQSLPEKNTGVSGNSTSEIMNTLSNVVIPTPTLSSPGLSPRKGFFPQTSLKINHTGISPKMPPNGFSALPIVENGFVEASLPSPQSRESPPILAEISSPSGYILRLYSSDISGIVRTFIQP